MGGTLALEMLVVVVVVGRPVPVHTVCFVVDNVWAA